MSNYATAAESWWDDLPGKCNCEPAWRDRGLIDDRCYWHRLIDAVDELRASNWIVNPILDEKET